MYKKLVFQVLFLLSFYHFSFAQKEGKLLILVNAEDTYIKIDSNSLYKLTGFNQILPITEGVHLVQAWATTRQLYKKTVTIKADSTSRLVINLPTSPEFKLFRETASQDALSRGMAISGKVFLVTANIGLTYLVALQGRSNAGKYKIEATDFNNRYIVADNEVYAQIYRDDFYEAKRNYQKAIKYYNTKLMIGVPITLCSYYLTYRAFKKINGNKPKKTVFKDKNPLVLRKSGLYPTFEWASAKQSYGLCYELKF